MADEKRKGVEKMEEEVKGKAEEKKTEKVEKKEDKSGNKTSVFMILGIIVILIGIAVLMFLPSGGEAPSNDAEVIASALEFSRGAMQAAEDYQNITISRDSAEITRDDTTYLVTFSITQGNFSEFGVVLNKNLELVEVGLDGDYKDLNTFINVNSPINPFQTCAKWFNENDAIPKLVSTWYEGTTKQRYLLVLPKTLECNGVEYPYSLEIGDGYITTTLNNYYFTNGFNKGIAVNTMTIPKEDMEQGVFVYVDRVGIGKLAYSYQLKDKSSAYFDDFAGDLITDYSITVVPAIVWNCKFVNIGTKATGELNGTFTPGSEELALKTFACIFNKGEPEDVCSAIGIVRDEEGKISTSISPEYLLTMYETGLDSCKPDDALRAEVFYTPECLDCENQRRVLDKVAEDFGDSMELTYYCSASEEVCAKFVEASNL